MQKFVRVRDDKDLLQLKELMDEGYEVWESNVMPYVCTTVNSKLPQAKVYGGFIDYILIKDEEPLRIPKLETFDSYPVFMNGQERLDT